MPLGKATVGSHLSGAGVLLADGRVLLVGDAAGTTEAELFDPATGAFTATGSTTKPMMQPTATLLDGRVLVVSAREPVAELYDPTTGTFTETGSMSGPRRREFHGKQPPGWSRPHRRRMEYRRDRDRRPVHSFRIGPARHVGRDLRSGNWRLLAGGSMVTATTTSQSFSRMGACSSGVAPTPRERIRAAERSWRPVANDRGGVRSRHRELCGLGDARDAALRRRGGEAPGRAGPGHRVRAPWCREDGTGRGFESRDLRLGAYFGEVVAQNGVCQQAMRPRPRRRRRFVRQHAASDDARTGQ